MREAIKRTVCLLLAAVMLTALSACGGKGLASASEFLRLRRKNLRRSANFASKRTLFGGSKKAHLYAL